MKIFITGANGFLGKHLVPVLQNQGYDPLEIHHADFDLRYNAQVKAMFTHYGIPDLIFHLAAHVGGIHYNVSNPASILYDNVAMNTNLIEAARVRNVKKIIMAGSVCSYPAHAPLPMRESHLWKGYPEASNAPYGISKLMALEQLKANYTQHNLDFAYPVLSNLYGPGDRGFFEFARAHMLPNLIKQFVASPPLITLQGQGNLTRDFLYVEDAALALTKFIGVTAPFPVNIAPGYETRKTEIVSLIQEITQYLGEVQWDMRPDRGQLRRAYAIDTLHHTLHWKPTTPLKEGLEKTIAWYKASQNFLKKDM